MAMTTLESLNREVSVEELRERVALVNVNAGLRYTTVVSSALLRGKLDDWAGRANSFNIPLLAKAFVLWGTLDEGAPLTEDEGLWLLKAINSLPWYSRIAAEFDTDDSVLGMIIRQGFQRYYYDDPLDARIARTWMMFHELVADGEVDVPDPSGEMKALLGMSAEDLWVVGFMLWTFHVSVTGSDGRKWIIASENFVADGPRQEEMNELVRRVMDTVALTPAELRERYDGADSKYRDANNREGYWSSEFNILRDFPVVKLGDDRFCSPYPVFALTRTIDGFFYDLLSEFARRKEESGARGNIYDNEMNTTFGTLFERYVGVQLRQLAGEDSSLRGEFEYGPKRQPKLSTDWILSRPGRMTVLFECKAREAILDVQRYATREQLRAEIGKAIGKAGRQLARFIRAIDNGERGLEAYEGHSEFICVVVLLAPFPFHMIRDIRLEIEHVITQMESAWSELRDRIHFVPMSVRELETAVAAELTTGTPIEDQLKSYAEYREQIERLEGFNENGSPVFPRHLEEFIQENYGDNSRIPNPLCTAKWDAFCGYCQQRIFDEDISIADRELFQETQQLAFQLWTERGRPLWDADRDWHEAEGMIRSGSQRS